MHVGPNGAVVESSLHRQGVRGSIPGPARSHKSDLVGREGSYISGDAKTKTVYFVVF